VVKVKAVKLKNKVGKKNKRKIKIDRGEKEGTKKDIGR
jgi:hypothetical protein